MISDISIVKAVFQGQVERLVENNTVKTKHNLISTHMLIINVKMFSFNSLQSCNNKYLVTFIS